MKTISILADENIPCLIELLSFIEGLEINLFQKSGRAIQAEDLKAMNVFFSRSVTRVDKELIKLATGMDFVATATSGVDHINQDLLKKRDIAFYAAQGANANAVAEFVISSIVYASLKLEREFLNEKFAIVGYGNVGRALHRKLKTLGAENISIYDPPLREALQVGDVQLGDMQVSDVIEGEKVEFASWEEVTSSSVISFHIPFTQGGRFPTANMMNDVFFKQLCEGSFLINASRGEVCDEQALLAALSEKSLVLALDVWRNEPVINKELLEVTLLGTPHIAGYSLDAKIEASIRIVKAMSDFYGLNFREQEARASLLDKKETITLTGEIPPVFESILSAYNPEFDSKSLMDAFDDYPSGVKRFDEQRKAYPNRPEWKKF